ncbi:MAG TPA: FAD-binding oxidoreductase [Dehalococcoidia bacterium]|nr:FAD-binding oxidoreductase [Dehalococcoidia bacterium]
MTATAIAATLRETLPGARVLDGGALDGYELAGVRPTISVRPTSAAEVADVLRLAGERGWALAALGGGTMLDLGNPPVRLDALVDLSALNAVVDYQPDDLTLTVQAGVTLDTVATLLAERGQMLPLDVPLPRRATIGGALACDAAGPRALRYGTGRDLVIGMQTALPRQGLARSGGKVVKNVAGYDLAKLHIGGLGTLGIITEVTFKLWPSLAGQGSLVATFDSLAAAHTAAQQLLASQLFPAALELLGPRAGAALATGSRAEPEHGQWLLAALFLGAFDAVQRQTRDTMTLCTQAGAPVVTALEPEQRARLFDGIRDYGRSADQAAAVILRASVLPAQTAHAVAVLEALTLPEADMPAILARPGRGTARGFWREAPAAGAHAAIAAARAELAAIGGHLVVERAPAALARTIDAWGFAAPDLALMRRLKQAYDPDAVLSPGRFVGGL